LGTIYIIGIGINEWAETNNIVVIYPQTTSSTGDSSGCWDFWGYTNPNFAIKSGVQMNAVWSTAQDYANIVLAIVV
jgi:hypothetical protein